MDRSKMKTDFSVWCDRGKLKESKRATILRDEPHVFSAVVETVSCKMFIKYNAHAAKAYHCLETLNDYWKHLRHPRLYWHFNGWSVWEFIEGIPVNIDDNGAIKAVFTWLTEFQQVPINKSLPQHSANDLLESIRVIDSDIMSEMWRSPACKGFYEDVMRVRDNLEAIFAGRFHQSPMVLSHGDVHPDNFLIQRDGTIFVIDWGSIGVRPQEYDFATWFQAAWLYKAVDRNRIIYLSGSENKNAAWETLYQYRLIATVRMVITQGMAGSYSACGKLLQEFLVLVRWLEEVQCG